MLNNQGLALLTHKYCAEELRDEKKSFFYGTRRAPFVRMKILAIFDDCWVIFGTDLFLHFWGNKSQTSAV